MTAHPESPRAPGAAPGSARPGAGPDSLLARREELVERYRFGLRFSELGRVVSLGDGIAWLEGLPSAAMEELLDLEDGSVALVYHLGDRRVGAILLHQTPRLTAGTVARLSGRRLDMPVGDALLGRVVDPLGAPLDGDPRPDCDVRRELSQEAPPIVARDFVHQPLYTGNKIIDTMIPIGRGQRQLILGDNGLGKSSLALDAVVHQQGQDVRCVLVLIGQPRSLVVDTVHTLRETGALAHTTVVVAEARSLPGLKYLAPFSGATIAEHWMHRGRHTLVVYDDMTTHAHAYRELSLLLRRPPGREAYPGDIFFLHARLLERSTCLAAKTGGGSMTALPLVETNQGEIAAFIPTNLISITDGQIYLEQHLFASGFLPAIDISRSVSRIGGKAQHPRIKDEAGRIKLDYLQFLELEVFTRFGTRLEAGMARKIQRGRMLRELLKQEQLAPLTVEMHMAWLIAYNEGLLDEVALERVPALMAHLQQRVAAGSPALGDDRADWVQAVTQWVQDFEAKPPESGAAAAAEREAEPAQEEPHDRPETAGGAAAEPGDDAGAGRPQ